MQDTPVPWRPPGRLVALLAAAIALVAATAVLGSWWQRTVDDALARPVALTHESAEQVVQPRDLGASVDLRVVRSSLWYMATSRGWAEPVAAWWSAGAGVDGVHLPLAAPGDEVDAVVERFAQRVDEAPADVWIAAPGEPTADGWEIQRAAPGRQVDREATGQRLLAALRSGADAVEVPSDEIPPAIPTEAAEQALPVVRDAWAAALDRPVTLSHGGETWAVTPGDLDAEADLDTAISAALDAAARDRAIDVSVAVTAEPDAVAAFVDDLAADIDRDARDAEIDVDELEVVPDRIGHELVRDDARAQLREAIAQQDEEVVLPVDEHAPEVSAAVAERALPAVRDAVEDGVIVTFGDREWHATPRRIGAEVDANDAVGAALRGDEPSAADVDVTVPEASVSRFVDEVAAEVDRSPRHGGMDWSSGWIEVTEPRDGRSVDQAAATERLAGALRGDAERVELPVNRVAARSGDVPERALLLRQNERRLYLYVDGQVANSWPVAVGQPSNPTPTGVFTVGATREYPSWTNPAPHGWGADMPRHVAPGPNNPLGVRALNWNRGGVETLIRFHGTADTHTIGQAASRGCVRLTNPDVRELYASVSQGTTIISVHG